MGCGRRWHVRGWLGIWALVVCPLVLGQESTSRNEVWPEIDVYINIKPKLRLFLLATSSRSVEDGELLRSNAFEAQFGAHLDYLPNDHLVLRTGYRFGTSLGDADEFKEHRFLTEQTLRKRLAWEVLLSDRNREDFRVVNGDFSFRYRNRVTVERDFRLFGKRTITPYASAEAYYDTRYDVWNKTRFAAGMQITLRRGPLRALLHRHQTILDIYYMRQHDTRAAASHVNAIGVVVAIYR